MIGEPGGISECLVLPLQLGHGGHERDSTRFVGVKMLFLPERERHSYGE
jgi:hypothetical protein